MDDDDIRPPTEVIVSRPSRSPPELRRRQAQEDLTRREKTTVPVFRTGHSVAMDKLRSEPGLWTARKPAAERLNTVFQEMEPQSPVTKRRRKPGSKHFQFNFLSIAIDDNEHRYHFP